MKNECKSYCEIFKWRYHSTLFSIRGEKHRWHGQFKSLKRAYYGFRVTYSSMFEMMFVVAKSKKTASKTVADSDVLMNIIFDSRAVRGVTFDDRIFQNFSIRPSLMNGNPWRWAWRNYLGISLARWLTGPVRRNIVLRQYKLNLTTGDLKTRNIWNFGRKWKMNTQRCPHKLY